VSRCQPEPAASDSFDLAPWTRLPAAFLWQVGLVPPKRVSRFLQRVDEYLRIVVLNLTRPELQILFRLVLVGRTRTAWWRGRRSWQLEIRDLHRHALWRWRVRWQAWRRLVPFRWKVLQQFLCSLVEPLLVFLLIFAGLNRMLGSTYPNELLCSGVINTKDESPDVNG
jgi:hypothetical protein